MMGPSFTELRQAEKRENALTSAVSVAMSPSYQATKLALLIEEEQAKEQERLANRTELTWGDPTDLWGTRIFWLLDKPTWEASAPHLRNKRGIGWVFVPTYPPAEDFYSWPKRVQGEVGRDWSGDYALMQEWRFGATPYQIYPENDHAEIWGEMHGRTFEAANTRSLGLLSICGIKLIEKGGQCSYTLTMTTTNPIGDFFEAIGDAFEYIAQAISTVVSFIPGVGTAISGVIQAGIALANGEDFGTALISGMKGALPGGPVAKAAFDVGQAVLEGKRVDEVLLAALPIPPQAKELLGRGLVMVQTIAEGKPITDALIQQAYQFLPEDAKAAVMTAREAGASIDRQASIIMEYAELVLPEKEREALNIGMAAGYGNALKRERMLMMGVSVANNPSYRETKMADRESTLMSALRSVAPSFQKVDLTSRAAISITPERIGKAQPATLDKFARAGFEVSKTDSIVAAGRAAQPNDNARKGFDIAQGALHGVAINPNIAWIRDALPMQIAQFPGQTFPPGQRQGFDLGHALHVGRLTAQLPPEMTDPDAAYAFLMARGISNMTTGSFTAEQKAEAVRATVQDAVARQGVEQAIAVKQAEGKGFWDKVKEFFGL